MPAFLGQGPVLSRENSDKYRLAPSECTAGVVSTGYRTSNSGELTPFECRCIVEWALRVLGRRRGGDAGISERWSRALLRRCYA